MSLQRWKGFIKTIGDDLVPDMKETDKDGYYLASDVDLFLDRLKNGMIHADIYGNGSISTKALTNLMTEEL